MVLSTLLLGALACSRDEEAKPPAPAPSPAVEKGTLSGAPAAEAPAPPASTTPPEVAAAIEVAVSHRASLEERKDAITALGAMGHEDAVLPLAGLLEPREGEEALVPLVEQALAGLRAAKVLYRSMEGTAGETRAQRLKLLAIVGKRSVFEAVAAELTSRDAEVREEAAASLARVGDPRAVPMLARALDDRMPAVRIAAAQTLGQLGGPAAVSALAAAQAREQDGFVKPVVQAALRDARARR